MKLRQLLHGIKVLETNANMEMEIGQVAYDSRKVTEGALFVAISGFASDGNRFIPMALSKGVAITTVSKMLGHRNTNITQKHYAKVCDDTVLNDAIKML